MAEQVKPKKKIGRPPWTPEQRAEYYRKKAEREAAGLPAPERGMGGTKNFAINLGIGETPEDKAMVSRMLGEARLALKQQKPKSDEELEERIDGYFEFCQTRGVIPTVEEMCLYIGYTRQYVQRIRAGIDRGFSPRTKVIFDRMMEFMATFDAKLVMAGKVRDAVYIFRGKNYHDMKDQQEVTINANAQNDQEMSKEDLEKWFLEDGKKVMTTFSDDDK